MREKTLITSDDEDVRNEPVGYVPAPVDATDLAERLSRFNRKTRRAIIARARKQARAANRKGAGK